MLSKAQTRSKQDVSSQWRNLYTGSPSTFVWQKFIARYTTPINYRGLSSALERTQFVMYVLIAQVAAGTECTSHCSSSIMVWPLYTITVLGFKRVQNTEVTMKLSKKESE